jgi:hypothetical protein
MKKTNSISEKKFNEFQSWSYYYCLNLLTIFI